MVSHSRGTSRSLSAITRMGREGWGWGAGPSEGVPGECGGGAGGAGLEVLLEALQRGGGSNHLTDLPSSSTFPFQIFPSRSNTLLQRDMYI